MLDLGSLDCLGCLAKPAICGIDIITVSDSSYRNGLKMFLIEGLDTALCDLGILSALDGGEGVMTWHARSLVVVTKQGPQQSVRPRVLQILNQCMVIL